jgi:hypothetical protein
MHNGNKFGIRGVAHLESILSGFTIHRPINAPCVVVLVVKGIQVFVCSIQAAKGAENYFVFHGCYLFGFKILLNFFDNVSVLFRFRNEARKTY